MIRALATAAGLAAAALAAAPAGAPAHSLVRVEDGTLKYLSSDVTSRNHLTISRPSPSTIRVDDPTADGGLDSGPCVPISTTRVECQADGIARVYAEVGELDDVVAIDTGLPAQVLAGPGDDEVTGSAAPDEVDGGEGDDVVRGLAGNDRLGGALGADRVEGGDGADTVQGGRDADTVDGGPGDDLVRALDSFRDNVICGDGVDKAEADPEDSTLPDCERIEHVGTGGAGPDTRRPLVRVAGVRRVRLGRRTTLRVLAATDESGLLSAQGTVRIGGRTHRLATLGERIDVAGAGAALTLDLPRRALPAIRAAVRRGRAVTVRVRVYAVDAAGNRSRTVARTYRLVR